MVQEKRKRLAPRIIGWLILAGAIAAPAGYLYLYEEPVLVTAETVTTGSVEETVSAIASGNVVPEQDSMITSTYIGAIMAIPVEEGDRVKKGDLLVELNHEELDAHVALAEANLTAGRSRLSQVRIAAEIYDEIAETRVNQTLEQMRMAELDFERISNLTEKGGVSQAELDRVETALRVAQESHAAAVASKRENEVRRQEIKTAEANVKQLEAAVEVAKASRKKAFVRAPFDGVVAKIMLDVGEAVSMGVPLLQLVQDDFSYVSAPFDEANAAEIAVGQRARINLDAYRDTDFSGEVVYISPVVSLNRDLSRTLDVKIRVTEGKDKFMAGMSADVTLLVDEKTDVVYAPSEALVREQWAFVVVDGRVVRREVEPGIGNWDRHEIVNGLSAGDMIVTSVSVEGLEDGARVEIVDELEEE